MDGNLRLGFGLPLSKELKFEFLINCCLGFYNAGCPINIYEYV